MGGISSLRMILLRITTWENRWDIEVLIRGLKALGLEKGSFLTWLRNKGFIALKAFSLLVVLLFKYFTFEPWS